MKLNNKKSNAIISILLFCVLLSSQNHAFAQDPNELKPYLRKSTKWNCQTLGKEIPVNIYYITRSTHSRPWNIGSPVIVYVKNHGYERIGQEPDASILTDYLKQRYIVITIDFQGDPNATSPRFDKDLHDLFKAIYATDETALFKGVNLTPRKFRCFFLPAGCRLATDLVFWELDKHGANGTLEFIMKEYNQRIANVVTGKKTITSPQQLSDRESRLFRYQLAMDIIYPSQAKKKVPLVFTASTQVTRHPHVAPRTYRPHTIGFLMRGYAYAIIDHCYNPIRRHFWYTPKEYSLNPWTGLAAYTASIRYIRAHAEQYNIDERYIGGMGHSKGEYSIARLTDPNHAGQSEAKNFDNKPAGQLPPQPWQGYSSQIAVGYQSPGSWPQYITKNDVPTLVTHGEKDRFGKNWPETFKKMEELDTNHIALSMKNLGHELPYGYDQELGIDRYQLVHDFFDQYLKIEEKLPPAVLIISPPDKKQTVSPSDDIWIHFAPEMDADSVINGVKVISLKDNKPIKGNWKTARRNTRFTFTPEKKLNQNQQYKIIVTTNVKNQAGTNLDKQRTSEFKITKPPAP